MENISSKEGHLDIDLEKGRLSSESVSMKQPVYSEPLKSDLDKVEEGEVLSVISSCGDDLDKKESEKKPKVMSAKKPPRPPRGLSLDSADQKLIREIHELAKFKRARIERMKALKKAKEAKTSSSSSSKNHVFATLLTVLFGVILLFQGISSRTNSGANFDASPIPSEATDVGVISVQERPFPTSMGNVEPEHKSRREFEKVSGFDSPEKVNVVVG